MVAESGSNRRIKCLLARVTGIPVLKRSFLDRPVFSTSMCCCSRTHHMPGVPCPANAFWESLLGGTKVLAHESLTSVSRCIKAGRWLTAGRADVWLPAGEGHKIFQGHRVFLSGSAAALEPLRSILPYAGTLCHFVSSL